MESHTHTHTHTQGRQVDRHRPIKGEKNEKRKRQFAKFKYQILE